MAADLPLVFTRLDLQKRLAAWPDSKDDTTWALCFAGVLPGAGELAAIREAAKICDRVAVARLVPDEILPPKYADAVREAGADLLWCPREVAGKARVDLQVPGMDVKASTLLAQALITVLPNLVVVERGNLALAQALRGFQAGLGDLFTLRAV